MNEQTQHSVVLKVATMPTGIKDVADLLNSPGGAARYEQMIRDAKPHVSWMIDHLDHRHDLASPVGASDAAADIVDVLLGQPPVARARYVRELAAKLGEDERTIRQTLNDVLRERGEYYRNNPEQKPDVPVSPEAIRAAILDI
jgi:DNA primase